MINKDKTSVIISLFKRKGGEGTYTKIIDMNTTNVFQNALNKVELKNSENWLIASYFDLSNWTALTNKRLVSCINGVLQIIYNENITGVTPAMKEEFGSGVKNLSEFTKLKIKDRDQNWYVIHVEKGKPFSGFLQVLSFIKNSNH